ncbi:hypothetical protein [Kineococcus sp. G2]|uniref:hypothetical protein n=1 Tax=Kineococcus sp. G2 TaxID=3127484 RepID=UPI00301E4681
MSTFPVPPGDPAGLRDAAGRLSGLSGTLGEARGSCLRTLGQQTETALPTARVAAFAGARGQATTATSAVGASLVAVAGALADYADALEATQRAVRDANARHDDARARGRAAETAGDLAAAQTCRAEMSRQAAAVDTAGHGLSAARQRVVSALGHEVGAWVPDTGSLTPVRAWQQAAAGLLPPGSSLDAGTLLDAYHHPDAVLAKDVVSRAVKLASKGYQLYDVLGHSRVWLLAQLAERRLVQALGVYQELKGSSPDLDDPATWERYLAAEREALRRWSAGGAGSKDAQRAQQLWKMLRGFQGDELALANVLRRFPSVPPADVVRFGFLDRLAPAVQAAKPVAARVVGPVSVVTGAVDLHTALTDDAMASDDRVARGVGGGAAVVGGVATTALALGIATGPVGVGVVAVAGVVAVGAWAYENREEIADGARRLGGAISDGAGEVADAAEEVAGAVGDGARQVWKGLFG